MEEEVVKVMKEGKGVKVQTAKGAGKICEICEKTFTRDLKRHMKTHTGERPFTCRKENCVKAFARSDPRNKHEINCGKEKKAGRPKGSKGKKKATGRKRRA